MVSIARGEDAFSGDGGLRLEAAVRTDSGESHSEATAGTGGGSRPAAIDSA